MADIKLRSLKGSPLTHSELDNNFRQLFNSASVSADNDTLTLYSSASLTPSIDIPLNFTKGEEYSIQFKSGSVASGSSNLLFNYNTNELILSGSLHIDGNITAQEFHTQYVSSSVIYKSGSTKFGDTPDDRHEITGSLSVEGNTLLDGDTTVTGTAIVNGITQLNGGLEVNGDLNVTGPTTLDHLTVLGPTQALQPVAAPIFIGALQGNADTATSAQTASYAFYAVSASHEIVMEVSSSHAILADTASYVKGTSVSGTVLQATSASFANTAVTSSHALSANTAISASTAVTASYALNGYNDADVADFLNGHLNTSIIPDAPEAYDLGSLDFRFRDIYLSPATIYFGDKSLKVDETGDLIVAGQKFVPGQEIAAGNRINVNKANGITTIDADTDNFLETVEFAGHRLTFTKGDGTPIELDLSTLNTPPNNSTVSILSGAGLDVVDGTFTLNQTSDAIISLAIDTGSAHFTGGVKAALNAQKVVSGSSFTDDFTFGKNLTVQGTLTAQQFVTEYVTSSVIFESGSTKFGDTSDDKHSFTGTLSVTGSIYSSGDVVAFASSDARLKDNLQPISSPIEKVQQIGGYEFDWNENQSTHTGHDIGVIAQEIEKILPELVTTRDDGYKAVRYEKIVALLIEAVKEQQSQIDELKARL